MAEQAAQAVEEPVEEVIGEASDEEALDAAAPATGWRAWVNVWHLPVLVLGMALLGMGVYLTIPEPQTDDWRGVLDEVQLYLKAGNYEEAKAHLERVEEKIPRAAKSFQARYRMLWGDLVFREQRAKGWDSEENHERIDRYYTQAVELGQEMDLTHTEWWAQTLVALDRYQDALDLFKPFKQKGHRRRLGIVKDIIRRRMALDAPATELFPLIEQFRAEAQRDTDLAFIREQDLWAIQLKAKLLLNADARDAASVAGWYIEQRLVELHEQGRSDDLAPLETLLAQAYQAEGELIKAEAMYKQARARLADAHDPLHCRILVGLGEVALAGHGDVDADGVQKALTLFIEAESRYPTTPAYLEALIGRAHAEALVGKHNESLEHFSQAVAFITDQPEPDPKLVEKLSDRLMSHHGAAFERHNYELALAYMSRVKPLYPKGLSAKLLAVFAATHHQIAIEKMARGAEAGGGSAFDRPSQAREALNREAAKHYEWAGDYYREFAQIAFNRGRLEQYAETSWRAAECYDGAQRWSKSIDTYRDFIGRLDAHPRRLDATNRLGIAYMAQQPKPDYESAREKFEFLLDHHPRSPAAQNSIVPLALCYMELDRPKDAEDRLLAVVTDHPEILPDSVHYRDALVALGKLYYRQGEFDKAIVQLDKAVTRYADQRMGPELCYFLADAYRQSVEKIDEQLKQTMPRARRASLQNERERRLKQGAIYYGRAIDGQGEQPGFESYETNMLAAAEQIYHRNAYFYQADCHYKNGEFERAIQLYDRAFKRWEYHPAALIALVQIVNAYCELGKPQDAIAANRKAMWALKRFPEESWNDPSLPMDRKQFQEYLRWVNELDLFSTKPSVASAANEN